LFCINDKYIAYAISTARVLFLKYYLGFPGKGDNESSSVVTALKRNPTAWKDFMMKFELGLEKPDPYSMRCLSVFS
jgi:hypothetical protein